MPAYLPQGRLLVVQLDDLAAGQRAEAEAVENDEGPGLLEHPGEVRVVHLGADYATRQRYQGFASGLRFLTSVSVSFR